MHVARIVLVVLLLLAIVVIYNPQVRGQAVKAWEKIQPVVMGITDDLYVLVRNLVSGHPSRDKLNDRPVPGPAIDFPRIVTLNTNAIL